MNPAGRTLTNSADANSVGDITPVEGVPPSVKHQLEEEAMDMFLTEMLGGEGNAVARDRFRALWNVSGTEGPCPNSDISQEYEARETPESKVVKDLDRLELALQAVEYERSQDVRTLHSFFTGSIRALSLFISGQPR